MDFGMDSAYFSLRGKRVRDGLVCHIRSIALSCDTSLSPCLCLLFAQLRRCPWHHHFVEEGVGMLAVGDFWDFLVLLDWDTANRNCQRDRFAVAVPLGLVVVCCHNSLCTTGSSASYAGAFVQLPSIGRSFGGLPAK